MSRPPAKPAPQPERSAEKLRHSNRTGNLDDPGPAIDAQNRLDRPEQAKGRPARSGPSNAGRDGGA
jgi:hypothetical protein